MTICILLLQFAMQELNSAAVCELALAIPAAELIDSVGRCRASEELAASQMY